VLIAHDPKTDEFVSVSIVLQGARDAVVRLYVLFTIALLAVYALVAVALELFVLPKAVYQPIQTMLDADAALQSNQGQSNQRQGEIIPAALIPADELGAIMRSRNDSVLSMRRHEADLAEALRRLEAVATDLARKNHLLEMARQNLADADRLASLGMMSAGIAHELNTPLAVIKGLAERLNAPESRGPDGQPRLASEQAALMLRVVGRLERLSESLLDFARVRPPASTDTLVRPMVDEAWTLVRLDREARQVEFVNSAPPELAAFCDADRIVQVLVNILRNAVDVAGRSVTARLDVTAEAYQRDGALWCSITITDNGPGIAPELLGRMFQPFVSTRLDSKGTGLGLAVAEGIVREHGGVLLARNRSDGASGAIFEIVLPRQAGIAHLPAEQVQPRGTTAPEAAVHSARAANST
jgi:C4-dicarboxylate-specific signal transduction histidine kinase